MRKGATGALGGTVSPMKFLPSLLLALLPTAVWMQQDDPKPAPARAEVGALAPVFRLNDHTGKLAAFAGPSERWSIFAFYPKAATPG